ncbi:hypothetical protein [Actinokineospora globicatena]|uniref:Uncharacterized protein n=1 Tax=Actinokineospora globicatena TaxID=103729 RepID=A0A9W6QNR7_9PSEU|nr:hypothetical protein [Actinokineospora globicatena]MCP2301062.1 hypothetical protein [Actinokineospora globicatena]GLW77303.1 hypothetical protein Aglo01_17850 [Actinokineospora globicatena]GLW84137.1 hypothetical protein Aglo02_17770 [Actinokineospora globicatena]GLW91919.1 hypothetical protein Aglo03_27350 [Actinokineospora globicatena]
MATALWIVAALVAVAILAWRLRKANTTLETILRTERDRVDPVDDDTDESDDPAEEPHSVGRDRWHR